MRERGGVELLLQKGTRIRNWIRMQERNVVITSKIVNGTTMRSLRIRNSKACFLPGGSVGLRMQGFENIYVAFPPKHVLEIKDLRGNLIKRNYFMCPECYTLTGEQAAKTTPAPNGPSWKQLHHFICSNCGEKWDIER